MLGESFLQHHRTLVKLQYQSFLKSPSFHLMTLVRSKWKAIMTEDTLSNQLTVKKQKTNKTVKIQMLRRKPHTVNWRIIFSPLVKPALLLFFWLLFLLSYCADFPGLRTRSDIIFLSSSTWFIISVTSLILEHFLYIGWTLFQHT